MLRADSCSWDSLDAKSAQSTGLVARGQLFLLLLIGQVEAATFVAEAEVIHAQHAQSERYLCANRIQGWIECFFRDAEVGDAHGHDAVLAPDEERQRRFH